MSQPSGSSHTLHSTPPSAGSSPLGPEAIDALDFAPRRQRPARAGGGFLLDAAFASPADSKGKRRRREGDAGDGDGEGDDGDDANRPSARLGADQLVRMALNLSESRRRNISAAPLLGAPARREGSVAQAGVGSSLRQYLDEQRRASRNLSPRAAPSPSRRASTALRPSPDTFARRDRARAYLELRAAYMRLLHLLPPLKDDANAPGNFTYTANAVPGSPHAYLTRTPSHAHNKHDLGRPYNPLQALRNRRSRARERLPLPLEPAAFADTDAVCAWVDDIEELAQRPAFRLDDRVALPPLPADPEPHPEPAKPSKAQQGWSFAPEELLADAYWLEQGGSKAVIEDRHGRKILPPRDPPKHKPDFLAPRLSKESSRGRARIDAVAGTDPGTGDESEHASERGRKRRLLPKIRADSRLRTGRGSPRKHSPGDGDSSDTDQDVRKVRRSFDEHNTGPLALQIKRQLELQTQGLANKTPAVDTPDTPDKWGRTQVADGAVSRSSLEVPRFGNVSSTRIDEDATLKMPPRTRTNPLTPIKSAEPRSSIEDDSTAPSTPLRARHLPHIGSDMSPPPSRDGSDRGKSKRSKFNPFHSTHDYDKHEQKQKHEPDATASDKKYGSRQTSLELQEPSGLGNAIFAAPAAVKNLLGHRKNESVSSLDSPDKLRGRGTQDFNKEPHSAVTRFFKGVKHEGTKVGDIIFRRDRADDTDASTVSDRNSVEFDDDERRRPALSRTVTSTTTGSVASETDGRSHLKLPSFRPVHEALSDNDDASDSEHHISRQSRQRRNDRSPRIDRLLPPRMDLDRVSSASSTATLGGTRSHEQDNIKTQLAHPGSLMTFSTSIPPTALKAVQNRDRSASRPTLDGKRHWSIADDHAAHRKKRIAPSQADIARVRALFLCTGVKAKEISRRANTPLTPAPAFLVNAARTAGKPLFPVPRVHEHVLAARLLVTDLERRTAALSRATAAFHDGPTKDFHARIDTRRDAIESRLVPAIFEAADQAVAVTSHVSAHGPLRVKQVHDDIDRMLRQRRRHTRWVMGWGWSAVEWGIVAALRAASIVFAVYGLVRSALGVVWAVVRWLLWL